MGKLRFTFTNILFWIGMVVSILIFDDSAILMGLSPDLAANSSVSDSVFLLLFSLAATSYLFMIIFDVFINRRRTNLVALGIIIAVFICGTLGIYLFNGMNFSGVAPTIVVTPWDKTKHILSWLLFALSVYGMIFNYVGSHPSIRRLKYLFIIFIGITYFLIGYSFAVEWTKYQAIILVKDSSELHNMGINSVFYNSNIFSQYLLIGIGASIGLNYYKKNMLSYFSIAFFTIIQVFVCSLTCIIISLLATFLFFLFEIIISFKKKKGSAIFKLAIMLMVYISVILTFIMCQSYEVDGVSPFCRYLYHELIESDYNTFTSRTGIWEACFKLITMNKYTLIFGYGFRNSYTILGSYLGWPGFHIHPHNGYINILLDTGIVGLSAFAIFVGFYIYCLCRMLKTHTRFSLLFALVGFSFFALSLMENTILFLPTALGMLVTLLFYMPVIAKYLHFRYGEAGDYVIEHHHSPRLMEPKLMVRGIARTIMAMILIVGVYFIFDNLRNYHTIMVVLENVEIGLVMLLVSLPYLCGLWAKKGLMRNFIPNLFIVGFLLAVSVSTIGTIYFYQKDVLPEFFKWLFPISIGGILLISMIVYSIIYRGKENFALYLNTFASIKTSLGSLIGAGLFMAGFYCTQYLLNIDSAVVKIVIGIYVWLFFEVFTFIFPFKDTLRVFRYSDEFDCSLMKNDVIRDRLEESYEI